jgi:hypothetical protein
MAAGKTTKKNTGVSRTRSINNPDFVIPESKNTLSVGCKLPHGIHLDIRVLGQPTRRVTLKGTNSLNTGLIRVATIGGYAVTEDVPKEFFEEWMKRNAEHPAVKNNLIFAHGQLASVRSMGDELEDQETGLEPINPNALPKGVENAAR